MVYFGARQPAILINDFYLLATRAQSAALQQRRRDLERQHALADGQPDGQAQLQIPYARGKVPLLCVDGLHQFQRTNEKQLLWRPVWIRRRRRDKFKGRLRGVGWPLSLGCELLRGIPAATLPSASPSTVRPRLSWLLRSVARG